MRAVVFAFCFLILAPQNGVANDISLPVLKEKIIAIAKGGSRDAQDRKRRSEEILAAESVPINKFLPPIADYKRARLRTHEAVVRRALAVLTTAVKGEGVEQETVDHLLDDFGVREDLTPDEIAFIEDQNPTTFDRVQFAWRYEAAWVMLWALSAVDTLDPPRQIVDVHSIGTIVRGETVESLMAKTELRPVKEILDQADLIYRYRWALVQARLKDREPPATLDPGVALERHRAFNWLIGYRGQDWDDVSPDT